MAKRSADRGRRILWRALLIISACAFFACLALLAPIILEYGRGARGYERARQAAYPEKVDGPEQAAPAQTEGAAPIDFDALAAINADVVGWLTVADTPIDYPIVWRADNDYYLSHAFDGRESKGGCLFLDGRQTRDFSAGNSLIYGHNMKDGSMFGTLKRYRDAAYAQSHAAMTLYTRAGTYRLTPFSAYSTVDVGAAIRDLPDDLTEAERAILTLRDRSEAAFAAMPRADSRIVTLVTCTGARGEERFVLHAIID